MNLHKNCSSLSIWSFHQILETKNIKYLIKNYDKDNEISLTEIQEIELIGLWDNIVTEYGLLTVDADVIKNYKLQLLITELEFKYEVCSEALDLYVTTNNIELLLLLNEFDFNINLALPLDAQIELVILKLKSLKNRIKIHKINYAKKYKKNVKKIEYNLDREAMILEINLNLNYGIDVRKTSVERWVNMHKLSKEKAEING